MREILFRGYDKDNQKWRYGFLVIQCERPGRTAHFLSSDEIMKETGYPFKLVIPESIGQYTGLKDKNGNKIFEGDIVKGVSEHEGQSNVFYGAGCWQPFDYLGCRNGKCFEVIGNIYDNPELLEES